MTLLIATVVLPVVGVINTSENNENKSIKFNKRTSCGCANSIIPNDYPSSIISYWKLGGDWDHDNHVADTVGNNDGYNHGATVQFSGKVGKAFSFDGVNDYVELPDSIWGNTNDFDLGAGPFTFEAWIKTDTTNILAPTILSKRTFYAGASNSDGFIFGLYQGELFVQLDGLNYLSGSNTLDDNTWHHVAATRNNQGQIHFYVDGVQTAATPTNNRDITSDTPGPLFLGRDLPEDLNNWKGMLDEIAIYDECLSASEIEHHYNLGLQGYGYGCEYYFLITEYNNGKVVTRDEAGIIHNQIDNLDGPNDAELAYGGAYIAEQLGACREFWDALVLPNRWEIGIQPPLQWGPVEIEKVPVRPYSFVIGEWNTYDLGACHGIRVNPGSSPSVEWEFPGPSGTGVGGVCDVEISSRTDVSWQHPRYWIVDYSMICEVAPTTDIKWLYNSDDNPLFFDKNDVRDIEEGPNGDEIWIAGKGKSSGGLNTILLVDYATKDTLWSSEFSWQPLDIELLPNGRLVVVTDNDVRVIKPVSDITGTSHWYIEEWRLNQGGIVDIEVLPCSWEPPICNVDDLSGFYLFGNQIINWNGTPIIIGSARFEINAYDDIQLVECFMDDNMVPFANDTEAPFEVTFNEKAFGRHTIKAIAYDSAGNAAIDERAIYIVSWT